MNYPSNIDGWPLIKVYDKDFRPCLLNMANSISELKLWSWLKNYYPDKDKGFLFSSHENISLISSKVDSDGHSGATLAYCFRCMEIIAKQGFDKFYISS